MQFLKDIYRLSVIKRYSNVPKIQQESVAEHCFHVAAICMDMHDIYDFNLGEALQIAISHDMPEMELNDAPHVIKQKYPQIKAAFEECEREVAKSLPTACCWGVMAYDAQECVESKIVFLADAMQCVQFSKVEVDLGNKGYMREVYINSELRVQEIKKELKQYER